MKPLGTVAEISTGYPFRKKVESDPDGDLVVVQIKDLGGPEGLATDDATRINSNRGDYGRYLLRDGDVLFQSRGSRHPAAVVRKGIRGIAASGLHVIRPDSSRALPDYLAWWLSHPVSQARLRDELARGSYIPFVTKADLERFEVALPPISTQRRIIEVEQLRARQDELSQRLTVLWNEYAAGVARRAALRRQ